MRKKIFNNLHFLKIIFFLLFLTGWPVVSVYSSVFPGNDQFNFSLPKVIDHEGDYIVPSIVLAQNQSSGLSNESFGEIIVVNTSMDGSSSIVSIESNQPVQYTAFKLLDPLRLILDFQKMNQGNLTRLIQVNKEIINSIRPIHFKEVGVLRLEINLNQMVHYQLQQTEKNKLIVHLQPSELKSELKTDVPQLTVSNDP